MVSVISQSELTEIVNNGRFFYPALRRYGPGKQVICDSCRTSISLSGVVLGYEERDLCLTCLGNLSHGNKSYQSLKELPTQTSSIGGGFPVTNMCDRSHATRMVDQSHFPPSQSFFPFERQSVSRIHTLMKDRSHHRNDVVPPTRERCLYPNECELHDTFMMDMTHCARFQHM